MTIPSWHIMHFIASHHVETISDVFQNLKGQKVSSAASPHGVKTVWLNTFLLKTNIKGDIINLHQRPHVSYSSCSSFCTLAELQRSPIKRNHILETWKISYKVAGLEVNKSYLPSSIQQDLQCLLMHTIASWYQWPPTETGGFHKCKFLYQNLKKLQETFYLFPFSSIYKTITLKLECKHTQAYSASLFETELLILKGINVSSVVLLRVPR